MTGFRVTRGSLNGGKWARCGRFYVTSEAPRLRIAFNCSNGELSISARDLSHPAFGGRGSSRSEYGDVHTSKRSSSLRKSTAWTARGSMRRRRLIGYLGAASSDNSDKKLRLPNK